MKTNYSPCRAQKDKDGNVFRVHWRSRERASENWKSDGISWDRDFPTDQLSKLISMSKFKEGQWSSLTRKGPYRSAQCKNIDEFRWVTIQEIKKLKESLAAKKNERVTRALRSWTPCRRAGRQNSHELTPSVQSWKIFTRLTVDLERLIKNSAQWDSENIQAVRKNFANHKKSIAEFESRLPV